jgi:hypothetical protein
MARCSGWSPGPLPGLRYVPDDLEESRKRRARSQPASLAEEGEARAALGSAALGDRRGKLSAPGAAQ